MKFTKSTLALIIPVVVIIVAVVLLILRSDDEGDGIMLGMFEAPTVNVSSMIPGRVKTVMVDEGDSVEKGQLVFTMETKIMDAKVGQAEGLVKAAESMVQRAKTGAREEEKAALLNQYKVAKSQFDFAEKTYKRFKLLYADSIISQQEMDEMEFKYSAAKDAMNAAKALSDMAENGARKEDIEAAQASYMQAKNVYEEAMAFYEQLDIKAPVSGIVSSKIAEEGEVMAPGFPVITLMIPEKIYAVLNVREDNLPRFKKGKVLKGIVPGLGNKEIEVKVTYIAVMPDFATWAPTKEKGEFDLKTFEVRLKPVEQNADLRPGMTIRIKVD
jgi:HlyD family secretion protein